MPNRGVDPRKQQLIRLAINVVVGLFIDLLLLGLFFVLFDWFSSYYLRLHEWKSIPNSLNKALAWNIVKWPKASGVVFVSASVCASCTMYDSSLKHRNDLNLSNH
jgi:hypothetical protein